MCTFSAQPTPARHNMVKPRNLAEIFKVEHIVKLLSGCVCLETSSIAFMQFLKHCCGTFQTS